MSPFSASRGARWGKLTTVWAQFVGMSLVAGVLVGALAAPFAVGGSSLVSQGTNAFNLLPDYLKIQPADQYTALWATQNGQPVKIAQFYYQNRVDVGWDDVAQTVKDAAVATEDPRFYSEGGIDVLGILRGAASTISGNGVQGGSSITQQYVKNVLVQRCESDYAVDASATAKAKRQQQDKLTACYHDAAGVDLGRKVQEIRYAIGMNKQYSKQQILLGYLNLVGFGGQVYGVEAAAQYYFGVSASQLDLNQSATLVAIVNNPANLRIDQTAAQNKDSNPDNGFAATKDRRNYVIDQMLKEHKITQQQADDTKKQPITPKITPTQTGCMAAQAYDAGFFCNYVQHVLLQDPTFGKTQDARERFFRQGGINVYTTLNLDLQTTAQQSLDTYIPHSTGTSFDLGASNVSMEVGTGRVVTMVQNKEYNETSTATPTSTAINYNTPYAYGSSNGFQTGSSFKPFVLADWLMNGHTLYQSVNGSSTTFSFSKYHAACTGKSLGSGTFSVKNDSPSENGVRSVLTGTEESINTIYMTMAQSLDLCQIHDVAKSMGVDVANPAKPWQYVPTSAIGVNYVSPLQMAQAYAGFANGGVTCTPIAIDKITRMDSGASVPVPTTKCSQGVSSDIADAVIYALKTVMTGGTGAAANPHDGIPLFGKTGTSDSAFQNWLVTSTSKVAQATWVGNLTTSPGVSLRSKTFTNANTRGRINGGDAKLYVAKPIIAALNKVYGGTNWAAPPSSMLYGKGGRPPVTTAPTQTVPANPPATAPAQPTTPTQPSSGNSQPAEPPVKPSTGLPTP